MLPKSEGPTSGGFSIVCVFAALGIVLTGVAIWWGLEVGGILN